MNCERAKQILVDYLLEETSAEGRDEIGRHLQDCSSCSGEIAQLQQTMGLLIRAETSEEIPKRIRLVAEPVGRWAAFWRDSARLALAGGGLLCLAIALLALFRTTLSYEEGHFQIAFGVPATATGAKDASAMASPVVEPRGLPRAAVLELIAEAVAASEAMRQRNSALLMETVAQQAEEQRRRDLREMAESLRYFQAAQTMMWKEQVQSQYLVSALMRQVAATPSTQP